jgi:hypothetical protein
MSLANDDQLAPPRIPLMNTFPDIFPDTVARP